MDKQLKRLMITIVGGFLVIIGTIFILIPGPAFLVLPVGLAILSLEYDGARVWLKKSQKVMKQGAEKTDAFFSYLGRKIRK